MDDMLQGANMICSNCGMENNPGSKFCEICGTPLFRPPFTPEKSEELDELNFDADIAPLFFNKWGRIGTRTLSWAKLRSEELERILDSAGTTGNRVAFEADIEQFLDELKARKLELEEMPDQVRHVYQQIKPSSVLRLDGITRLEIEGEKNRALEMINSFLKELEKQLFYWEVKLFHLPGKKNRSRHRGKMK